MFNNIISPLSSTVYGSISFFIVAAAYRALRARNREAGVLLVTGLLLLLRNAPIGPALLGGWLPTTASWLLDVVTAAAYRAIMIGVALGVLAQGVRIFMGIERSYLGREE
jgi:hypothetical protein